MGVLQAEAVLVIEEVDLAGRQDAVEEPGVVVDRVKPQQPEVFVLDDRVAGRGLWLLLPSYPAVNDIGRRPVDKIGYCNF